jgi:hypothetical protein
MVLWGGHTVAENYHRASLAQRLAVDIEVWRAGGTFRGTGAQNEHHWAWSQEVLAPANGTVVAVTGDRPDNRPGAMGVASGSLDGRASSCTPRRGAGRRYCGWMSSPMMLALGA